jgi:glycosyltransferase involved in cell wall biosynthesis
MNMLTCTKKSVGEFMKIIHVEDYFDPTAGYQINELLYASKDFNDEVYLITSKDMSPFHKEVDVYLDKEYERKTGITIIRLETRFKLSDRLVLKDLKCKIKKIDPEIVFMHGIGDFKDLQLWRIKPKYKIFRDCHMSWVASKNRFRKIFYWVYKLFFATIINNSNKYDVIYALGVEEYEYLKKIGISNSKIDYLPHGYNDSIMYYDEVERNQIRANYNFEENDIIISYIGKFNKFKRPDLILDIINLVEKEYITGHSIKLLFIGPKDNDYMDEFIMKIDSVKDKIKIVIDGSKPFSELRKYYSASDICIFPKETTLSSIHAQVCGCPVIMENYKSNLERIVNNKNLYKVNDIHEAVNILKRIINNNEFKKERNDLKSLQTREYKNQIKKLKNRLNSKKEG